MEAVYVIFCILVVVLIFFLAWYIPRFLSTRNGMTGNGRNIVVLEKIVLSKDSSIVLVKAFGKLILVGITPHGMEKLMEAEETAVEIQGNETSTESFTEILKKNLNSALPEGKIKEAVGKMFGKKGDGDDKA